MAIGLTEQISGPHVFYMKPTRWKSDYRSHKFPLLVLPRAVLLAAKLGTSAVVLSIYTNHLIIENTDYGVVYPKLRLAKIDKGPRCNLPPIIIPLLNPPPLPGFSVVVEHANPNRP